MYTSQKEHLLKMEVEENNINLRSDPLADPILQLAIAVRKIKVVAQALEMGLFDEIEKFNNCVTVDLLAMKLGFNTEITERVLNALVCFKLLDKTQLTGSCRYNNSPSTQKYLLKTKKPSLISLVVSEVEFMGPLMDKLSFVLKKGSNDRVFQTMINGNKSNDENIDSRKMKDRMKSPSDQIQLIDLNQNQTPVISPKDHTTTSKTPSPQIFMSIMDDMIAPSAPAITKAFDFSGHKKVLDLGGNSGYLAYEFIKTYPPLRAAVFDLPGITLLAKRLQPEQTKSQVQFVAGDFFINDLPLADLIVLSHVIHNWEKKKIDAILEKVYNTLPPGGCILVVEKCLDDDKTGPEESVIMDLSMAIICEGRERTRTEYKNLLEGHGFKNIKIRIIHGLNSFDVIKGNKPY